MILENAVHNGSNVLAESILIHITHIDGLLCPLIVQHHIRHQLIFRDMKFLHRLLQSTNSIVRQCIMNASSNANTLIGYKMSYYRSMYGIDICNADLNYCLIRAKPLCLTPDQHAQVNCLYELSLAKSNHIIIDGLNPDEITDTIIAIATGRFIY